MRLEICSECHPFYTGKQKFVDSEGRVERFEKKYARLYGQIVPDAEPQIVTWRLTGVSKTAGRRFRLGGSNLRRAGLIGTIAFVGLLSAALVLFVARGNDAGAVTSGGEVGFLKIVAYPWAEIYVDGEALDTTPTGRALRLGAGEHSLRLTHPDLPDYVTTLQIEPGTFQRLRVDLTGSGRFDASGEL